jgi:hypothetical protein
MSNNVLEIKFKPPLKIYKLILNKKHKKLNNNFITLLIKLFHKKILLIMELNLKIPMIKKINKKISIKFPKIKLSPMWKKIPKLRKYHLKFKITQFNNNHFLSTLPILNHQFKIIITLT